MHKLGKAEISTHYTPTPDWNTAPARKSCHAPNSAKNARQKCWCQVTFSKKALLPAWQDDEHQVLLQLWGSFRTLQPRAQNTPATFSINQGQANSASCFSLLSLKITSLFLFFILDSWEAQFYTESTNSTYYLKYNLLTPPGMPFQSTQQFSQLSLGWIFFPWCSACNGKSKSSVSHIWNASLDSLFLWEYKQGIFKTDNKKHVLLMKNCQEVCRKINCSKLILRGN